MALKTTVLVAGIAAFTFWVASNAAFAHDVKGYGGYNEHRMMPCYGTMGHGMMGQGMAPGMMGHGMMGQGMAPGMMGHGMAPGMMGHGMAPGMMGRGSSMMTALRQDLSVDDVKHMMEHRLAWDGNPNLKVGKVEQKDDDAIVAEIVTQDGSIVDRLEVDRHTGQVRRVN
jgi:hypothetical protein